MQETLLFLLNGTIYDADVCSRDQTDRVSLVQVQGSQQLQHK